MKPSLHRKLFSLKIVVHLGMTLIAISRPLLAENQPDSDVVAAYEEGQRMLKGDGIEKNDTAAFERLKVAADARHADAQAALGYCYLLGVGTTKDEAKARELFEDSAKAGSTAGMSNYGVVLMKGQGGPRDVEEGERWLQKSIDAGLVSSSLSLADIYYMGSHADGVPDYKKAHEVLLNVANAGNAAAQNMIGVIHQAGRTGSKDEDAARVWFERAAWAGNGKACFNLARLWNYQSEDRWARIEAIRWLLVGESLKESTAVFLLKDIRKTLDPNEIETASALANEVLLRLQQARTEK